MAITSETILFLIFLLDGAIVGLLFDIFRILRKSFKTPDLITYIEDIGFGILSGAILIFSIIIFNKGELRLFIFLGIILGLIIYMLTVSKYVVKISVKIIRFITKIVTTILKIILSPIILILKKIENKFKICINKQKETKNKNKKGFIVEK